MKLYTLLFISALGLSAQAETFLCPDGSVVQLASNAPYIAITKNGGAVVCRLSAGNPNPGICSVSSIPSCGGARIGLSQCSNEFGEKGICVQDLRTNQVGSDGNTICGCGVGE